MRVCPKCKKREKEGIRDLLGNGEKTINRCNLLFDNHFFLIRNYKDPFD